MQTLINGRLPNRCGKRKQETAARKPTIHPTINKIMIPDMVADVGVRDEESRCSFDSYTFCLLPKRNWGPKDCWLRKSSILIYTNTIF